MFKSHIIRLAARRPRLLASRIVILGAIMAVVASAALAGPVPQASANTAGGDNFTHGATAACLYRKIHVTVTAGGWENGQAVTTRVLVRRPGGAWQDVSGWRTTYIYPFRYYSDWLQGNYSIYTPVDMYSFDISTAASGGGYREVGVEFYWWNRTANAYTASDLYVVNRYNDDAWGAADPNGLSYCFT
jgi:hypothetical protein